jgi:hypothetical protein
MVLLLRVSVDIVQRCCHSDCVTVLLQAGSHGLGTAHSLKYKHCYSIQGYLQHTTLASYVVI